MSGTATPESSRLAIVTGTSSGIGEALARQLLADGWAVTGIARRPTPVQHPRYRHLSLDLTASASLAAAVESAIGPLLRTPRLARVALVNNAADVALLGQLDQVDPTALVNAWATNTVAPIVLAGWVLRSVSPSVPVRIVNVSSGAAIEPFPGLGSYGATKAALRLAGMVLAAELDARASSGNPRDATIWSYEPGVVATPMQAAVRGSTAETMPIVQLFKDLHTGGQLREPAVPAAEILHYLNGDGHPRFSEQRFVL